MKKLILTASFILATTVSAVDLSVDTSNTQQSNQDTSMSTKNSKDIKDSKSKKDSTSYSKDKSKAKSKEVSRIANVDILDYLAEQEEKGVYPFSECQVIANPKTQVDFGITAEDEDEDYIDTNLKTLLDNSAASNSVVSRTIDYDKLAFLDYLNCINFYGSVIGQSLKTGEIKSNITDREILKQHKKITKFLTKAYKNQRGYKIKFHKQVDTFQINRLKVKLDYEPTLDFNKIAIYGQNFFGYTANSRKTFTLTKSKKLDRTIAKDKSVNLTKTKDKTLSNKLANNKDYSTKTNFSIRNYLPK